MKVLERWRSTLGPAGPAELAFRARRTWWNLAGTRKRVVTLHPAGPPRARVLFSYLIDPFLLPPGFPVPHMHTNYWETRRMAETFVEAGCEVDAIHWSAAREAPPREDYDFFIDVRMQMERLGPALGQSCRKVFHAETAHPRVHNAAQRQRLEDLRLRRGIVLAPFKNIDDHRSVEQADLVTVLGNEFTIASYRFAGKPIHRIPLSAPFLYEWPAHKDFASARRRFLWFGSEGFVHKGLDLVLEAFAGAPDLELVVCGPLGREPEFRRAFARELFHTPNIRAEGWVDVRGERFREICRTSAALVYASCSEGGGGSVIQCMHAGLIPVVSRESSVDVEPGCGVVLPDARVETLRAEVRALAERPAEHLRDTARGAWEYARAHHTREVFAGAYRAFVAGLLGDRPPASPNPPA